LDIHSSLGIRVSDTGTNDVDRLFREHNATLLRFIAAKIGSEQEAREIAQEAYVHLLQLDHPEAISYLRAFLFKTAANLAVDRLRQRGRRTHVSEMGDVDFAVFELSPERQLAGQQAMAVFRAAVEELPAKCRQAFLLHRVQELTVAPIIVIAGDGRTAKASFDSPGIETLSGAGHKPDARWGWCKYGVDFIHTNHGWRIWHMHVYGILFSPFDKSWVDAPGFPSQPSATDVGGEWPKPTRAQSGVWIYTGEDIPPLLPRPPLPYRTFGETFSY
jgi:RNA polymerase sigma factor (sigma-70 family)